MSASAIGWTPRNAAIVWAPLSLKKAFFDALTQRGFHVDTPKRLHLIKPNPAFPSGNDLIATENIAVNPLDEIAASEKSARWTADLLLREFVGEFAVSIRWNLYRGNLTATGIPAGLQSAKTEIIDCDAWEWMQIDFETDRAIGSRGAYEKLRVYESRFDAKDSGAIDPVVQSDLLNTSWRDNLAPAPRAPRIPQAPKVPVLPSVSSPAAPTARGGIPKRGDTPQAKTAYQEHVKATKELRGRYPTIAEGNEWAQASGINRDTMREYRKTRPDSERTTGRPRKEPARK
jgi:hypothetical protein